jgi:hypothetical protein
MKHHNNSGDAASLAPSSQQQTPIPAAPLPAPRQQNLFNTRRDSAPTLPAAPQTSPRYAVLRTPAVPTAKFLINVAAIRNLRKQLKTIANTQF